MIEKIKDISIAISSIMIPIIIVLIGNSYSTALKEKEMRLKMIEMAIGILNQKPIEENRSIRNWAIEIVNKYSEVELTGKAREALLTNIELPKLSMPYATRIETTPIYSINQKLQDDNALLDELLSKDLIKQICEAKNFIKSGAPNSLRKACDIYHNVINKITSTSSNCIDKSIIKSAENDYNNGFYVQASSKYEVLFEVYYKYCH